MTVVVRRIIEYKPGTEQEVQALERDWNAWERQAGGRPPKRYYGILAGGGHHWHTLIWEREWEDLTTREATFAKKLSDDLQARAADLNVRSAELYTKITDELYWGFTLDEKEA